MDSSRRSIVVLLLGVFLTKAAWGQEAATPAAAAPAPPATKAPAPPAAPADSKPGQGDEDGVISNDKFITFENDVDDMDVFKRGGFEYLFINDLRTHRQAALTCEFYNGILAYFLDVPLLNFIAEALSETRLELDTLWVAGIRDLNSSDNRFFWKTEQGKVHLTDAVQALVVDKKDLRVQADDRNCLGFGRLDHDSPQLRPLSCNAKRNLICVRLSGGGGGGNSTHPGWIKIRSRLYKIYAMKMTYDSALTRCPMLDKDASLAVVSTFPDAQALGRYLLIGRPSLENAWMGAKWEGDSYKFESEPIVIDNATDGSTKYPPWRQGGMRKPGGCLLLDRHLANITLFVEARCERERGLICYKPISNGTNGTIHEDVIIGEDGYRLISRPMLIWEKALAFCKDMYSRYGGELQEILEAKQTKNLLYVMGENKTAVQHIWLAAFYNKSQWTWQSKQQPVDLSILNWVQNRSYDGEADLPNTCLNMDRENHIQALHYGTDCTYSQKFVCHFPAEQLRQLQNDEANNKMKAAKET